MRVMLLGFAAPLAFAVASIPAAPASAQSFATEDHGGHHNDRFDVSSGGFGRLQGCDFADGRGDRRDHGDHGDRHDHGRRDGSCNISVGTWYEGGEWARWNNRTWESDSYNDWWHDQPWRSYPRWVTNNQDCARRWWQGGGWRC